ncbi:MAG: divalent-cation tolerance protein CutA [Proteobacteria bacterium]|nr:divalent-cation tolerance protein CutA [Pseudomonadota bacterium]
MAADEAADQAGGAALVYATFPDLATAERIGGALVEARLAACLNVFPGMRAIYRWQGELHAAAEVAALVKTRASLVARVIGFVRIAHPYVNPALVELAVAGGSADFLDWIRAETAD